MRVIGYSCAKLSVASHIIRNLLCCLFPSEHANLLIVVVAGAGEVVEVVNSSTHPQ